VDEVMGLLEPPPNGILQKYQVSSKVNDVRNDSPDLHERVGGQGRLF